MAEIRRVRDRATFEAFRRRGLRAGTGPVSVTWVPGPDEHSARVAYAIGRRFGSAVERNRARRRLRALMAERAGQLSPGAYLVGLSSRAATMTYAELRSCVSSALHLVVRRSRRPEGR